MERIYPLRYFKVYTLPVLRPSYYRRATRGDGGWEVSRVLFWKSIKVPWFWKKGPDCIHLCVIFFIQNVVLRVSRKKNAKVYPVGLSFLVFLTKCLWKCPNSMKPSWPCKNFWLRACISFGNFCHPQTRSSHDFLAGGLGYWFPKFSFSWYGWQLEISDLVSLVG